MLLDTDNTPTPLARREAFPPSHWKHLLKLLGLIIVADRRVLKEEVDAYLEVVAELRILIDPTVYLTKHMARDWFLINRKALEDTIDSLAYDTVILETIAPIKSLPCKLDVVSGMVKIAISDGKYSNVERGLIKKTILYWNISAGKSEDIDYSDEAAFIEKTNA